MTQHTPGPWKVIKSDFVISPDGTTIAQVGTPTTPTRAHDANARLIAAAPGMFDTHRANREDAAGAYQALVDGRLDDAHTLIAAVSRRSEAVIAKVTP